MSGRHAVAWDVVMHLDDETTTAIFLEVSEGDAIRSRAALHPEDVANVVALARRAIAGGDNEEFDGVELQKDEKILFFKKEEGVITYWFERFGSPGDPPADIAIKDFRLLIAEIENAADDMKDYLDSL